jgi:enamine deaminase RidA (YjgF/YER057c/UK114 family)|tara:strand:- start:365 stop:826 length:462 start_codon:yes stop_codon:yes gene_type:complete
MSVYENLKRLNLNIPKAPDPVGDYVAYKKSTNLLFISGQISIDFNGKITRGKLGKELSLEEGRAAAKLCAINIIAQAKIACNEKLENITNCIKLTGYVNSTNEFTDQPKIINAASELISAVFGENGKHTRAAISTNSLPLGAAVEIEAIFELK